MVIQIHATFSNGTPVIVLVLSKGYGQRPAFTAHLSPTQLRTLRSRLIESEIDDDDLIAQVLDQHAANIHHKQAELAKDTLALAKALEVT